MKTYIFKSQEIFLRNYVYEVAFAMIMAYLFIGCTSALLLWGTRIPAQFWAASFIFIPVYAFIIFLLYIDTKPEIPTFVIFENNMIRIITRFGKTEIPIEDIRNVIYDHKDGIFFIRLKNGNYKTLRDVRITESQRKDFEDEIRKINEKGEKYG